MTIESIDLRTSVAEQIRTGELLSRRNAFIEAGFTPEWVSALQKQRPTLYSPFVLSGHLSGLRERGFANPNKMIESSPAILSLAFENIDRRLKLLERVITLYNLPYRPVELMETYYSVIQLKD